MTSESAFERPVFAVSGRTFGWGDIVCAATAWGRWAECERAARRGRSALLRAQRTGIALTGGEFEAAEDRFRRERRLLAADELVSWLARRDVEVSEWRDYIRGVVLRRRGDDSTPLDDPGSGSDFGAAVWAYAMGSGGLAGPATP
jgi:hypothetical protein